MMFQLTLLLTKMWTATACAGQNSRVNESPANTICEKEERRKVQERRKLRTAVLAPDSFTPGEYVGRQSEEEDTKRRMDRHMSACSISGTVQNLLHMISYLIFSTAPWLGALLMPPYR